VSSILSFLTKSKNPEDLLKWMNKNLTYEGAHKGYLRSPEQVVKDKVGHCWETTELANLELTKLGYICQTLYMTNNNLYNSETVTHSTLIYKDKKNNYYWFEWAWYKYTGIHGPYFSIEELIKLITTNFIKTHKNIAIVKLSDAGLHNFTNEVNYINSTDSWKNVLRKKLSDNIIFKWE